MAVLHQGLKAACGSPALPPASCKQHHGPFTLLLENQALPLKCSTHNTSQLDEAVPFATFDQDTHHWFEFVQTALS